MEAVEVKVRMDKDTRDAMGRVAESIGISANSAFNVFARQFVAHRGFPFEVVEPEPAPTREEYEAEMARRLAEVRSGSYVAHGLVKA